MSEKDIYAGHSRTMLEVALTLVNEKLYNMKLRAEAAETDKAELEALFDSQQRRMPKAIAAYQNAHGWPVTRHPDLGRLIDWLMSSKVDAEAEVERLEMRDLDATIELCYDDGNNPFARETLKVLDVSVSDNIYVVESKTIETIQAEVERLREEYDKMDQLRYKAQNPQDK